MVAHLRCIYCLSVCGSLLAIGLCGTSFYELSILAFNMASSRSCKSASEVLLPMLGIRYLASSALSGQRLPLELLVIEDTILCHRKTPTELTSFNIGKCAFQWGE